MVEDLNTSFLIFVLFSSEIFQVMILVDRRAEIPILRGGTVVFRSWSAWYLSSTRIRSTISPTS
jgi:hypothetical protein